MLRIKWKGETENKKDKEVSCVLNNISQLGEQDSTLKQ